MFVPAHMLQDNQGNGVRADWGPEGMEEKPTLGRFWPADLEHVEDWDSSGSGGSGSESGSYVEREEHVHEAWERKAEEADERGITESLTQGEGVKTPVVLHGGTRYPMGTIQDGHHRVAAANDVDKHMEVPVSWRGTGLGGPSAANNHVYRPYGD